ncbi:immunoglobulin superfamily member 22-like [Tachypleus tridentatus]|uniref:immunoglobulin superfamily member 22-like n=1 Tax=Tachypleus tridentatus TaxID=6853 RepID=UPI003FD4D152
MSTVSCKVFEKPFYLLFKFALGFIISSFTFRHNYVVGIKPDVRPATDAIQVLQPLPPITEGDLGSRLTLQCKVSGYPQPKLTWLKDGQQLTPDLSWQPKQGYMLLVSAGLNTVDAGNYTCMADSYHSHQTLSTILIIRTPPGKLTNVTVHPSTVVATVRWHLTSDGGYPVTHFTLLYYPLVSSSNKSGHLPLPVHISPSTRQFFIYHLQPGTEYVFRIWATNRLGPGEPSTVQAATVKPMDPPQLVEYFTRFKSQDFTSSIWMIVVSLVIAFVLLLSVLSCILIYKDEHNEIPDDVDDLPKITSNPGFGTDLEESYLLEQVDFNANIEVRTTNNTTVAQPSQV